MSTTTDFPRESYLLWNIFTVPDDNSDGTRAVAMSRTHGNIFIALYSTLITALFVALWGILSSLILLFLVPRKLTRTTYITIITTWTSNDPYLASVLMLRHSWHVLRGILRKAHPIEFTWRAFRFDVIILAAALLMVAASFVLGTIMFPAWLVIGNVALVNPRRVFFPFPGPTMSKYSDIFNSTTFTGYCSFVAQQALAAVDSLPLEIVGDGKVIVQKDELEPRGGESRYALRYGYTVTGAEMGLQHLGKLHLTIDGSCSFQDDWYKEVATFDYDTVAGQFNADIYELLKVDLNYASLWDLPDILDQAAANPELSNILFDETNMKKTADINMTVEHTRRTVPRVYPQLHSGLEPESILEGKSKNDVYTYGITGSYSLVPHIVLGTTLKPSTDPWYATRNTTDPLLNNTAEIHGHQYHEVKPGRPVLLCREEHEWALGDWKGKLWDLVSEALNVTDHDNKPPVQIPQTYQLLLLLTLATPMIPSICSSMSSGCLSSAARLWYAQLAIDTTHATAEQDMSRLVHAAYIATREIFRDTARGAIFLKPELSNDTDAVRNMFFANYLTDTPFSAFDGMGDFIVTSRGVQTLRLSALISAPSALLIVALVSSLLRARRKAGSHSAIGGLFERYKVLVSGLEATQLYRMIDQLLVERASMYDSNKVISHRRQGQWRNQTSKLPYVVDDPLAQGPVILPEFHVQLKDYGQQLQDCRLMLSLKDDQRSDSEAIATGYSMWRSMGPSDPAIKMSRLKRQRNEESMVGLGGGPLRDLEGQQYQQCKNSVGKMLEVEESSSSLLSR